MIQKSAEQTFFLNSFCTHCNLYVAISDYDKYEDACNQCLVNEYFSFGKGEL